MGEREGEVRRGILSIVETWELRGEVVLQNRGGGRWEEGEGV